jgi:hypothetical protein
MFKIDGIASDWFWENLTIIEDNLIIIGMEKVLQYGNILFVHVIKSPILNQFVWLVLRSSPSLNS